VKDAKWDPVVMKPNATQGVAVSTPSFGSFSIAKTPRKISMSLLQHCIVLGLL